MQPETLSEKALAVYLLLTETYGERPLTPRREPMHELVSTMLSHRTNAANEKLAYERMWAQFGSWANIRDAPIDALIAAIAPATYPEAKAPNIQRTLAQIHDERGEFNINFLRDWPAADGLHWLKALPGVGVKTATLVLLFCFAKPLLPVDTHVHRVSGRLGLIPAKASAETAHMLLLNLLPTEPYLLFNFHKSMLRHGQALCTWSNPKCTHCPLRHLCDYYHAHDSAL